VTRWFEDFGFVVYGFFGGAVLGGLVWLVTS